MIKLDITGVAPFLCETEWKQAEKVNQAAETLISQYGETCGFTSWLNLPETYDKDEFKRLKAAAAKICADSEALVVVGVGGSYLGARAAIELLCSPNYNLMPKTTPNIYFVGNNLSGEHINEIKKLLADKDFSINVISKSGETLEPAIAFRIFKELLESKYGVEGAKGRIYATTDQENGSLRRWADLEGFETFCIPPHIGGRFSILTAVGLLPMAVAGIDIDKVMTGAFDGMQAYTKTHSFENPAWQYAAVRQALYRKGKVVEILACYEPAFRYMAEWWKQLYGESEGKAGGGIFPASVELTADLHSMGQYIQEGLRNLIKTVVSFGTFRQDTTVPATEHDIDGLNYLAGQGMQAINHIAKQATKQAHIAGGVPVMEIALPQINEAAFGQMVYFFQFACALSGYIQGVNPFDQPGVEAYKRNMFELLGRPGNS